MSIYAADSLFNFAEIPAPADKPQWMNLRARRLAKWRGEPAELTGPGLYGAFLDGELFYIGLYAGKKFSPFGGSVLDRWFMHSTYHLLRAPEINFAASKLSRILSELSGPVSEGIANCLPDGRATNVHDLAGSGHPLLQTQGATCTFNKVRFAEQKWDSLAPGSEDQLLRRLSFVYGQIPRSWQSKLDEPEAERSSKWVKREWLSGPELRLIQAFRPICNHQVDPGTERSGVAPAEVQEAILDLLNSTSIAPAAMTTATDQDDDQVGDSPFIARTSEVGEQLLLDLRELCPTGMQAYPTDTPDLRIGSLRPIGRNKVLVIVSPELRVRTQADTETCRRIGFEDATADGRDMVTKFTFDPTTHGVSDLIAVAGAAVASLAVR